MKAIEISEFGGPEVLNLVDRPVPACGDREVLLKVGAAGVNRPDATQRRGLYPPPPGITDIPGLDVAGRIERVGVDVQRVNVGDFVCGLVAGGAYAEYVALPAPQILPLPNGLDLVQSAALPEVFFTAWNKVIEVGRLQEGESILVQGGTSGVGRAAIQIAKQLRGARVIATAGSDAKCAESLAIGADVAIRYDREDWTAAAFAATEGRGLDVILDAQAGDYVAKEVEILAVGGRLVLMATHRNVESTINFRSVVRRRLTIAGSVIRSRTPEQKGALARALETHVWPLLGRGAIQMAVQRTFALEDATAAHRMLESNEQSGKLVLIVDADLVDQHRQLMASGS